MGLRARQIRVHIPDVPVDIYVLKFFYLTSLHLSLTNLSKAINKYYPADYYEH